MPSTTSNGPKSLDCIRLLSCLATAKRDEASPSELFASRWPQSPHVSLVRTKATIPAGTNQSGNWGDPTPAELFNALVAFAAPFSVLARFQGARVPFNSAVPVENTALSTPAWAGPARRKSSCKAVSTASPWRRRKWRELSSS